MQTTILKSHRSVTSDEDSTSGHLNQLCRFCAKKNNCMLPIFRGQGLTEDLPTKIKAYLPVQVSEDDTLPLQVCSPCVQCLSMWHEFITGCLKADENLRTIYQEMLNAKGDRDSLKTVAEERDNQQITEGKNSIQQGDNMALSTVELTNENAAEVIQEPGSNDRFNTYSRDRCVFETTGSKVISDTFNKKATVETQKKIVPKDNNVCLTRPIKNNHYKSHIMQKSCQFRTENSIAAVSETSSDYECPMKNGTVQNMGSTVTVPKCDEVNTSNCQLEKEFDQTMKEVSSEKQMINLCNSEHNKVGEFKSNRKFNKLEGPDHGGCLHMQSDAAEDILNENDGPTKQNPTLELLEKHSVKSGDKKSFCCSDCNKVFSQKDTFLRHLRIHTDERPFTCHICGKGFRDSGGLTRHLRDVHARVKNFKCDICGRLFAAKATCDDHRRTHTGERPFICAICGKRFSSKASHYMHGKTHTDIFPYNCNFCERHFRRRQELLIHKMTHTGERPCSCDVCGREFRVSGELQRHKFVHSKDKPYCCAVCGMSFRQKRYLGNHFKKQHKDI